MKNFKMVAAVATVMMTASAFAQTSTDQSSSASSSTAAPMPTTGPAATAGTAAPASTSTASLTDAKKEAQPRPWKVELYHRTDVTAEQINYNKGVATTQNYVGWKTNVGEGKSAGVRQLFTANYQSNSEKSDFHVANTYLHYTDAKLFTAPGGVEGTGIVRLYLPTGESARFNTKENGSVRGYLIGTKTVGKFDFSGILVSQYWSQSQNSYMKMGKEGPEEVANVEVWVNPNVEASYNFSKDLTLAQSFGVENTWYRPMNVGAKTVERSFNSTTTVSWKALPQLTLNANLSNDINTETPGRDFAMFREEEMTVILEASVAL